MPTYRGISLSLISQFDILALPEYAPPTTSLTSLDSTSLPENPTLLVESQALVSVYSPTYASSQFWLRYSISPPYSASLYYFKLYLNNKLFVSWGCGEQEGYCGKTIFGLFDSGESWMGTSGVEKRVLYFAREKDEALTAETTDLGDIMEVRVFRARGRKRIRKSVEKLDDSLQDRATQALVNEGQVRLLTAGNIESGHPQRYYKYALIDPTDQPFASFRYHFRTWEQLDALGIGTPRASLSSQRSAKSDSSSSKDDSTNDASSPQLPQEQSLNEGISEGPAPNSPTSSQPSTATATATTQPTLPTHHQTTSQISLSLPAPPPDRPTPSPQPHLPGSFPLPSPSPIPSLPSLHPRRSFSPFDWLRRTSSPTGRTSSPFHRDPSPRDASLSSLESDPKKREKSNLSTVEGLGEDCEGWEALKERKKRPGIGLLKGVVASATRRRGGA
ncbi:MAG: hypothetical protein M1812_002684 [Candelaria pacifica]|nr:MAG: hypothetical protein M1812_002684 [Candelaria pacifica]